MDIKETVLKIKELEKQRENLIERKSELLSLYAVAQRDLDECKYDLKLQFEKIDVCKLEKELKILNFNNKQKRLYEIYRVLSRRESSRSNILAAIDVYFMIMELENDKT